MLKLFGDTNSQAPADRVLAWIGGIALRRVARAGRREVVLCHPSGELPHRATAPGADRERLIDVGTCLRVETAGLGEPDRQIGVDASPAGQNGRGSRRTQRENQESVTNTKCCSVSKRDHSPSTPRARSPSGRDRAVDSMSCQRLSTRSPSFPQPTSRPFAERYPLGISRVEFGLHEGHDIDPVDGQPADQPVDLHAVNDRAANLGAGQIDIAEPRASEVHLDPPPLRLRNRLCRLHDAIVSPERAEGTRRRTPVVRNREAI